MNSKLVSTAVIILAASLILGLTLLSSSGDTNGVLTKFGKKITVISPPKDRIVYLTDEVGENALDIAKQIQKLDDGFKPIFLVITSPGGSVLAGGVILAAMEGSRSPVITVCKIYCASMAAIIFEYGDQRLMQSNTVLMFHQVRGSWEGELEQVKSRMRWIEALVKKIDCFIASRANLKCETFLAMQDNELWLDSQEAIQLKFADGLVNLKEP